MKVLSIVTLVFKTTYSDMWNLLPGIIFMLFISCNNNATGKRGRDDGLFNQNKLNALFIEGQHKASLISNKQLTVIQQNVLNKSVNLIKNNEALQYEFYKIAENPESFDFNKNIGLSKKEFDILLSIFASDETSKEQELLSIIKESNLIQFKGSGRLSVLDSLVLNVKDTLAVFKTSQLSYYTPDSSYHTNEFIPPGDKLTNIFPFDGPSGLLKLMPMNNKYFLLVGQLKKSSKTYLYFYLQEQLEFDKPFNQFYSIILD